MNKIKVTIFHTGKVRVDRAISLHENNPLAVTGLFRGTAKKMDLPVSVYLIEHPKGKVLIDTGWDTKYATERPKQLLGMVDKISAPIIEENEGIDSKLKTIGLLPSDIDHVFISHMDFDHTSGLRLVKEAKDIRCSVEEWNACNKCSLRYVDTQLATRSLDWLMQCKQDTSCIGVYVNHDPAVLEQILEVEL